jgi:TRAP-type transport system periplasmic protein
MKMKAILLAVAAAGLLSQGALAADYTLRLGHVLAPTDPLAVAAEGFKAALEERTGGAVEVQLFPSSQLGDTQDMLDQAQAGANVGTFAEASRFSPHVEAFNVLVAPYAFLSVDELVTFTNGPTFAAWNQELTDLTGLTILSFN